MNQRFAGRWLTRIEAAEDAAVVQSLLSDRIGPEAYIPGTPADDVLTGTDDDDTLDGGEGADAMSGGLGNDVYIVDNLGDSVSETGAGIDAVWSCVSFVLGARVENLVLTGEANIAGTGNSLANVITGNSGRNVLDGKQGADTMIGGDSRDKYYVDNAGDVVIEFADNGRDVVHSTVSYTLSDHIEKLTLNGTADLDGTGNAGDNIVKGNSGNNVLDGGDGNDLLIGSEGMFDTLIDVQGDGFDTLNGGAGDMDGLRADWSTATDAIVWVNQPSKETFVNGNLVEHIERMDILSGSGDDHFDNSNVYGHDVIDGGAGNDRITSGLGFDVVYGGEGDDTLSGGYGKGVGASETHLYGGGGNDVIVAGFGLGEVSGDAGNDVIFGTDGSDRLMFGGDGSDRMIGAEGDDNLNGGEGDDTLSGDGGEDALDGGGGNDVLIAGASPWSDQLSGGDGDDTLVGGTGIDDMSGGTGSDIFALSVGSSIEFIRDFTAGTDQIQLNQDFLFIGNRDTVIDDGVAIDTSGGFSAASELVILLSDIGNIDDRAEVAAAFGSATSSYEIGQTAILVVDDGLASRLYYFESQNTNAAIEAGELSMQFQVFDTDTGVGDYLFGT